MNENFNIMISLANQFEVDLRLQKLTELANLSDKYCNRTKTIFIERLNSLHAFMQQKKRSIPMDKEANEHSRKYTYSINRSRVHVRYMAEK